MSLDNIYSQIPNELPEELFTQILKGSDFTIERIVSKGHTTPVATWLEQEKNEWVLLIKGNARIRFDRKDAVIVLTPGDHLLIPAHQKHRVEWTTKDVETIWLAIHFQNKS